MVLLVMSIPLLIILIAAATDARKDDRIELTDLFSSSRSNEPCSRRSSSEYCTDEDLDDRVLDYLQNVEKSELESEDKRKGQLSSLLNEVKLSNKKRTGVSSQASCDCLVKYGIIDLGYAHYPRYLISAMCQGEEESRTHQRKCWRGSRCKPVEYKVKVLTRRGQSDILENDITASQLPDSLRTAWKFKTITITTGCYCSF